VLLVHAIINYTAMYDIITVYIFKQTFNSEVIWFKIKVLTVRD